jgi:hypothetical protein
MIKRNNIKILIITFILSGMSIPKRMAFNSFNNSYTEIPKSIRI